MDISEHIERIFPGEEEIPGKCRLHSQVIQEEYLINGELRCWNGSMQEVISPVHLRTTNGILPKVIGRYPLLTACKAREALSSAVHAYNDGRGIWPRMPFSERIRYVEHFLMRMKEEREGIVRLLMWEIGKSYQEAEQEFDRTIDYVNHTVDALRNLDRSSSQFVVEQKIIGQIRRAPLGVVLCMGPFNYPLNETLSTMIPALLMGNTVIFKPPKIGVLLLHPFLRIFKEVFPPGVINSVYGDGKRVIPPLMSSGKIDVLAFIGSSRVAELLKNRHPKPHRLRSVLGLEAKNPAIILPDADLDIAIRECVYGSLAFNGQRCTALKIIFVHTAVVDHFLEKFTDAVSKLKFGMPWKKDVTITPMPEPGKTAYLAKLIDDAKKWGAGVVNSCGGMFNRTFIYPAVLYPVSKRMKIYREEQFGPLVPVIPFNDVDIPIQYIIGSGYGQQVSIFGNDINAIALLVDIMASQVCRVNINSMCQRGPDIFPFAGRKDSGEGTLSVTDALRIFSIRTIVAAKETERNREMLAEIVREGKSKFLSNGSVQK
jgi:glyceraldehyde-3-phosphate dehydrogenase (NADP+)